MLVIHEQPRYVADTYAGGALAVLPSKTVLPIWSHLRFNVPMFTG